MNHAEEIKSLFDQGHYSKAARLVDEHKITDCRNICQNLPEITDIADCIEHSITILSSLEEKINNYESELRNVKDTAFQIEEKEHAVQVQCKNLSDTCTLIEELFQSLRIPDDIQRILLDGKLNEESIIGSLTQALDEIGRVLQYVPDESLQHMRCVREQKAHAANIMSKFSQRFYDYFTDFVEDFLSEYSESFINNIYSQAITMPGHDVLHNELLYLAPIVAWITKNDKSTYQALSNSYIDRSKKQYDKELKIFFECAKEKMTSSMRHHHTRLSELSSESRKRNSIVTGGESSTRASSLSGTGTMDTQDAISGKSSEISYTGWDEFDAYIEKILHAIDRTCLSEQRFYSAFFPTLEGDSSTGNYEAHSNNLRPVDMFGSLEKEFIEFANFYNSQNGLYSLYLLVRFSQYLQRAQDNSHLFQVNIYPKVLIEVKRNFDNFMKQQLNAIRELKVPKNTKCGVLSVVKSFEQFVKQVESLITSTGAQRTDRWYLELVTELSKTIDRVDNNKTPTEMIRLENYNYLHDVLSSIKNRGSALETQKKEVRRQYEAARDAYVSRYFGRPLEKVNIFFEGVQAKVAQGVKEEEISFQSAFSKQELRKVLQMVTLKEVRKGLEEMYRRIEKHASEPDSNLKEVIWRAMQVEFLSQYMAIQRMIERCYPSSNLSLTFTENNVLRVFSDIAQSH